jgi:hypothetical protein
VHGPLSAGPSALHAEERTASAPAPPGAAPAGQVASNVVPRACGALNCQAFPTPEAAFEAVLSRTPRVLAVGEAHAQQGTSNVRSSTRRFAEELLPLLSGKSKHIVIELLVANCKPETVTGVVRTQEPVTKPQAQTNQAEFLTLGKYAQRLGIEPQALTPTCADYNAVIAAGDAGIGLLLSMVAQQTQKSVEALLAQAASSDILVSYGGALHNDLYPRPGQEDWSFGPGLARASSGRYVELDLIVPEFVKDNEAWRHLPWFSVYDRAHPNRETLLYEPAPNSFALIFPRSDTTAPSAE